MKASRAGERGFTLIEMLVVLGIMTALAAIAIPVFLSGRATNRRTAAENAVRAALTSARDAAVERRSAVAVKFFSNTADPRRGDTMEIWATMRDGSTEQLGSPIALPDFIKLDSTASSIIDGWGASDRNKLDAPAPAWPDIVYLADGTVGDPVGETEIVLNDMTESNAFNKSVSTTLRVLTATGLVIEGGHYEDREMGLGVFAKGWL